MPKPVKKPKRPASDPNRRAKQLLAEHMERAEAGPKPWDSPATTPTFQEQLSAHMARIGAKGGKISGAKRMANLTDEQRREIAAKAARARWAGERKPAKKGQ